MVNEQLQELVKQARIHPYASLDGFSRYEVTNHCLEQFAELIVRECMSIVNQEGLLTDYVSAEMNKYAGKRLKNAWLKIEQHFGVEE
jgi:Fe2+ or Zn2+ uptake regulation protein